MSRRWCFTINNYKPSDWFAVKSLFNDCVYGVCGEEVGKEETPHLQGYVKLKNTKDLVKMKKYLPRAHLEMASSKSTDIDNQKYCSKENQNVYEVGEPCEGQGTRNDIKEVANMIRNGTVTMEDVMFDFPELYLRYSRSFEKMFNAVAKPRNQPPEVIWRWGLAGTGKTRYCKEKHPDNYVKDGTPWWDNYKGQEAIIIDDFDNQIPFRTLLRLLDRYSYQGQIKGGYVEITSPFIYITCEFPPEYFWSDNELAQVKRRLTSVDEIK